MKGWDDCPNCHGIGSYVEQGDLHRSTGSVPCYRQPFPNISKGTHPNVERQMRTAEGFRRTLSAERCAAERD